MGFLNKLFGSNNANDISKTAEMLDEETYWIIVQESLDNSDTQDGQKEYLVDYLQKLVPKDIVGFRLRTDKLLQETYNADTWCAAYIINGGCSDDGFEYFRNWVISRGKDVYYKTKENPDSLVEITDAGTDGYEFEEFWYVALDAFTKKTGKDLYDYIDDSFSFGEIHYPGIEFNWQEDNPGSMQVICPRLFDKFIHQHN